MKIVSQLVGMGMVAVLCACSGKPDTPAPKAQQAEGQASVAQPAVEPAVKEVPRDRGRMLLEPVDSSKFKLGPKPKDGGGKSGAVDGSK